ncbi:hypothetical protein [Spiroplasma endosymbiont of Zeiraphera isertana]|uniref:hypothetical protein n=1 Tax=Spiroplasma endosymbiont of Zeiraphera isertana TaxID=3066313 RepID=UPI00313C561C
MHQVYWNKINIKNYRKRELIMLNLKEDKRMYLKYEEIEKIFGSCDICNKNSSYANRTCNKCFYKLMSDNDEI